MKRSNKPRTYILSAALDLLTAEDNTRRTNELACDLALEGVPYREATGKYNGRVQESLIVVGEDNQETVFNLARTYDQESVLVVAENDRAAYLVALDSPGYFKHLGRLVCVGDDEPEGDWTRVEELFFTFAGRSGVDLEGGL